MKIAGTIMGCIQYALSFFFHFIGLVTMLSYAAGAAHFSWSAMEIPLYIYIQHCQVFYVFSLDIHKCQEKF